MRLRTAGLELDAVLLDDFDLARRHRPGDFLDRNREGYRKALRNLLAILLSRGEDDVSARARGPRGDRPSHDLAVAIDLHLTDCDPDREIVKVVSFPADDERPPREELARFRLLRDLLRQDPVGAPARESRGPRLAIGEGELARLPQRGFRRLGTVLDHGRGGAVDVRVRVAISFLQMLLHELVVRPRIASAEDQVTVRREGPPICLEPHRLRRLDARLFRG